MPSATPLANSRRGSDRAGRPVRDIRPPLKVLASTVTVGLALVLLWFSARVLLLAFVGIVLAIVLRGAAGWLSERTRLSAGTALILVIGALIVALVAAVAVIGTQAVQQSQELAKTMSSAIASGRSYLEGSEWGRACSSAPRAAAAKPPR
ncbi:MAG TPA: AI-2E family transporter [Terriglobales bacterium]|nr:AI-2E family transporter [Terriglobales bacterium]